MLVGIPRFLEWLSENVKYSAMTIRFCPFVFRFREVSLRLSCTWRMTVIYCFSQTEHGPYAPLKRITLHAGCCFRLLFRFFLIPTPIERWYRFRVFLEPWCHLHDQWTTSARTVPARMGRSFCVRPVILPKFPFPPRRAGKVTAFEWIWLPTFALRYAPVRPKDGTAGNCTGYFRTDPKTRRKSVGASAELLDTQS